MFSAHSAEHVREVIPATALVSKLNERERKQAALPITVFGMALVSIALGKIFDFG